MSHVTKKKKEIRKKNRRMRVLYGFNTGTRNMGFESNQHRKEKILMDAVKDLMFV